MWSSLSAWYHLKQWAETFLVASEWIDINSFRSKQTLMLWGGEALNKKSVSLCIRLRVGRDRDNSALNVWLIYTEMKWLDNNNALTWQNWAKNKSYQHSCLCLSEVLIHKTGSDEYLSNSYVCCVEHVPDRHFCMWSLETQSKGNCYLIRRNSPFNFFDVRWSIYCPLIIKLADEHEIWVNE